MPQHIVQRGGHQISPTVERVLKDLQPLLFVVDVRLNVGQQVTHVSFRPKSQLLFDLTIIVEVVLENEVFQAVLVDVNLYARVCEPLDVLLKGFFLLMYNGVQCGHGFGFFRLVVALVMTLWKVTFLHSMTSARRRLFPFAAF